MAGLEDPEGGVRLGDELIAGQHDKMLARALEARWPRVVPDGFLSWFRLLWHDAAGER